MAGLAGMAVFDLGTNKKTKKIPQKVTGTWAPENGWSTRKGDSELELGNHNFLLGLYVGFLWAIWMGIWFQSLGVLTI